MLDPIFSRALAKAPAERYGTPSDMVDALANALARRGFFARVRSLLSSTLG